MLEITIELLIPFAIVAIGTGIAGLWDLFTTEVPDEISVLIIISSILYWFIYASMSNNFIPLIASLIIGTTILAAGWLLYTLGKWGGADALILAAVFYAIPIYPITLVLSETAPLFFFNYIINLMVVSLVYMAIYTVILGIKHPKILSEFKQDLKKTWKLVIGLPILITIAMVIVIFVNTTTLLMTWEFTGLIFLLMIFWRYAVVIETKYFTRKVPLSKLKIGDVLYSKKQWVGITKQELVKLRKTHKSQKMVTIKEGVRFVPVFFLTLLTTFIFGNILFFFLV